MYIIKLVDTHSHKTFSKRFIINITLLNQESSRELLNEDIQYNPINCFINLILLSLLTFPTLHYRYYVSRCLTKNQKNLFGDEILNDDA